MTRGDVTLPMTRCPSYRRLLLTDVEPFIHRTLLLAHPEIEGDDSRVCVPLCEACAADVEKDSDLADYIRKVTRNWLKMTGLLQETQADAIT